MERTEKAAVAVGTAVGMWAPLPHEPGPEQQLVREKKIQTISALLSSGITGWEESLRLSKP